MPVELAFTRNSQPAILPGEAVIEFGLKIKGGIDSELLVYHTGFTTGPGNLYVAAINCASTPLHAALGISDGDQGNDKVQVEAGRAEVFGEIVAFLRMLYGKSGPRVEKPAFGTSVGR